MNWTHSFVTAKRFMPHQFGSTVEFLGPKPRIILTKEVYDIMYYIVDAAPNEFGWLGLVERNGMDFMISEIFIVEQTVTGTTVDIEAVPGDNPMGELFLKLIRERGTETAKKIKAWIHSHVTMDVTPSGSYREGTRGDLNQMWQFGQNGNEYFIMGIVNKLGEMRFEIFFYDLGIRVIDIPWEVYEPEQEELRKRIVAEVRAKTNISTWHDNQFGFGHTTIPTHHRTTGKKGGKEYGRK